MYNNEKFNYGIIKMTFKGIQLVTNEGSIIKIDYNLIQEDLAISMANDGLWFIKTKKSIYKNIVAVISDTRSEVITKDNYQVSLYFKHTNQPITINGLLLKDIDLKFNINEEVMNLDIKTNRIMLHYNAEYLKGFCSKKITKSSNEENNKVNISIKDYGKIIKLKNIDYKKIEKKENGTNIFLKSKDCTFCCINSNFYSILYNFNRPLGDYKLNLMLENNKEIVINKIQEKDFNIKFNEENNKITFDFSSKERYFKYSVVNNDINKISLTRENENLLNESKNKNVYIKQI
jgi:hypothetical protein